MMLDGTSTDGGNTINYTAKSYENATGKLQTIPITLKVIDPDHFEVELKSSMPDGSAGPRMVSVYTRKLS
jgi:hypothetical protein